MLGLDEQGVHLSSQLAGLRRLGFDIAEVHSVPKSHGQ